MRLRSSTRLGVGLALGSLLFAAARAAERPTPPRALLALSKTDHTLSIVDPATLTVVARIPVGPDPHEVIASSDGTTAYVSNMGMAGAEDHELDIIDLVAQQPLSALDTGALTGLHGLKFADGKVWFTAQGAKAVGRFDPATFQIDWIMGTGQDRTHMIDVSPDAKKIYVTNVGSGTVGILENVLLPPAVSPMGPPPRGGAPAPHWDWVQTLIPVAKGSEGFDVSPDGKELWTAAANDGTVWIVDLASRKVAATLDAKALGANRLKFTPDGKRVLISSLRTGELFVFDAAARTEVKRLKVGRGAAGILMDAEGGRAFVGCTRDDYVAVVDLKTLKVTSRLNVGGGPDGLAWARR